MLKEIRKRLTEVSNVGIITQRNLAEIISYLKEMNEINTNCM